MAASCEMAGHTAVMCDLDGMAKCGMQHDIDEQDCFIECGCGCHNNIDSLPHQFSPHTVSGGLAGIMHASTVDVLWRLSLMPSLLHHDDPPPELS